MSVITPERPTRTTPAAEPGPEVRAQQREMLRTSRFDLVTSFFMALILFIGTFVLMMFILWLLSGDPKSRPQRIPLEQAAGRGDNPEGFERDFEPPGAEEVEELMEPTLLDTIEAVTEAVSNIAATLDTMNTDATTETAGSGAGDSRPPGPEGEGDDTVPRYERWQLNFAAKDLQSYARQLDFYRIELAAVGGGVQGVDYAFDLSTNPKTRRERDTSTENRLYFMWTSPSPLQRFDEQLLQRAGVSLAGRSQIRFIPPELEEALYQAEMQYAQSKGRQSVTEIAKTVFESKSDANGYAFEVVSQRYREPR